MSGQVLRDGIMYGCHVDLGEDEQPDGCVVDTGNHEDCAFGTFKSGRKRTSKWTCPFWKPVEQARK